MTRWTAPDLTDEEYAALAVINGLAWDEFGHADRVAWEEMTGRSKREGNRDAGKAGKARRRGAGGPTPLFRGGGGAS